MKTESFWELRRGNGPLAATAIHDGHELREEVAALVALGDAERLREEDPFTAGWTAIANTRITVRRSRFEVDLNRPRETAVYIEPEDAWGLQVWKARPPADIIAASLSQYDAFYEEARSVFSDMEREFGRFVVFDLHSYNHLREGPAGKAADPAENPEVNIGTGTMQRTRWAPLIDRFIRDLRDFDFRGRKLDVRENIKFRGGQFPRWIHQTFPETACALSIEFKKIFMDEWSGEPDMSMMEELRRALESTIPGVLEELDALSAA
jgi:hypothetical protein